MSISRLASVITCHAWNKDGTKVALCPGTNEIHIYAKSGNDYKLETVLTEHDQVVTGIDWGHKSNRIVSCSHDRNAYVWTQDGAKWKPVLVILRVNRCATHVRWSPEENKFAVATGAKLVSVCYFEEDNDWWVSKHIKKFKSTVLKVDWHPNNTLLAAASTDYKVRLFSGFIKGVDKKGGDGGAFGDVISEIDCQGWVQSVKFSPNGNKIAFVSQDSTVGVADVSSPNAPKVEIIQSNDLPFADLAWASDAQFVAAGHSCQPVLFSAAPLKEVKSLDSSSGAAAAGAKAAAGPGALQMFQNKVDKGQSSAEETNLKTKHQNSINYVMVFPGGKISTSGIDGSIAIWDPK